MSSERKKSLRSNLKYENSLPSCSSAENISNKVTRKKSLRSNSKYENSAPSCSSAETISNKVTRKKSFEYENSLPSCSSAVNSSNKVTDQKISKCDLFSPITSSVVDSQLRHFLGEKVDKEVSEMLIDHCNSKLGETFKAATDDMKSSGKTKFTIEDFEKGVSICDGNRNMRDVLSSDEKKRKQRAHYERQLRYICKNPESTIIQEKWLNQISPLSIPVSLIPIALKKYFQAVTAVLSIDDEEFICAVLKDLKLNRNILELVPYFINFFCDSIKKFNCDFIKMNAVLQLIDAFMKNPYVYFGQSSHSNVLVCALLKFIVLDLPVFDQGKDGWLLKDSTANTIGLIFNRFRSQHLFFYAIHFLHSILSTENTLNSHYGALVALKSLGVPAISLVLPSYIEIFQKRTILSLEYQNKIAAEMVQGKIIESYHLMVKSYLKSESNKSKFTSAHHFNSDFFLPDYLKDVKFFPFISQSNLYKFGEALLPSFPSVNFTFNSLSI